MPALVAFDLPVRDELIYRHTERRGWPNRKHAGSKNLLRTQIVKQRLGLFITCGHVEIVRYDKEDVNIVRLRFVGYVTAEDDKAKQLSGPPDQLLAEWFSSSAPLQRINRNTRFFGSAWAIALKNSIDVLLIALLRLLSFP